MIERFFRSLKEECVWQHRFQAFEEARRTIATGSNSTARGGLTVPSATRGWSNTSLTINPGGLISGEHYVHFN
jgi:hypothetical protein